MSTVTVWFDGGSQHEPAKLEMPTVPRLGDHITLESGTTYKIVGVHWDFTSKGLGNVIVHLSTSVDDAFAKPKR